MTEFQYEIEYKNGSHMGCHNCTGVKIVDDVLILGGFDLMCEFEQARRLKKELDENIDEEFIRVMSLVKQLNYDETTSEPILGNPFQFNKPLNLTFTKNKKEE